MLKSSWQRLLHLIPIMLGVSFLTFLLLFLAPGDAAQKKLTVQGVPVTQESLDAARAELGLDRPFGIQYASWLTKALRGDLGESYKDGRQVLPKLRLAFQRTLFLASAALVLALLLSLPLALYLSTRPLSWPDRLLNSLSFIGNSIPNFLISVLLMYVFCLRLKIFPVLAEPSLRGLILPTLALALPQASRFFRLFRAEFLEQWGRPHVQGALARGDRMSSVLREQILYNAALPILTIVALACGSMLGGSVVIETIFRWPGLGKLAMDAILLRDYPLIQGFVLLTSLIYVVLNLLADLACAYLDPRLRES